MHAARGETPTHKKISASFAPSMLHSERPLGANVVAGVGWASVVLLAWVGGLFAANVRIMCRLF